MSNPVDTIILENCPVGQIRGKGGNCENICDSTQDFFDNECISKCSIGKKRDPISGNCVNTCPIDYEFDEGYSGEYTKCRPTTSRTKLKDTQFNLEQKVKDISSVASSKGFDRIDQVLLILTVIMFIVTYALIAVQLKGVGMLNDSMVATMMIFSFIFYIIGITYVSYKSNSKKSFFFMMILSFSLMIAVSSTLIKHKDDNNTTATTTTTITPL